MTPRIALWLGLASGCGDGPGGGGDSAAEAETTADANDTTTSPGGPADPSPMTIGPEDELLVPTSTMTCADGYPVQINPSFPQPFTGAGASSCTIVAYSNVQPPVAGKVVAATIGVGPVTGPMRFVRLRILDEQSTGPACCSAEQLSEPFTPAANGLSTIPLSLEMQRGVDDQTGIVFNDWIGLEVLAPDVPIPGLWTANGGADLTLPDYEWLPALSERGMGTPTQNLRSEGSFSGFVPTFNVSFVPEP